MNDHAEQSKRDVPASGLRRWAALYDTVTSFAEVPADEAVGEAEVYFKTWRLFLDRREEALGADLVDVDSDELEVLWRRASVAIGLAFVPAIARAETIIRPTEGYKGWNPFLRSTYIALTGPSPNRDAAIEQRMLAEFLQAMWNCRFMELVGSAVVGGTPTGWDEFVFWSVQAISEISLASGAPEHSRLAALMVAVIAERARDAAKQRDVNDRKHRDHVFGPLGSSYELPRLAARTKDVKEFYGEKLVEARFEAQLAAVFQSLGFVVATADRGQRGVDLVCFAPSQSGASYSLLVEAKSTSRPYSLPTKDSRAILEYVNTVRNKLTTLPPLKLVLLVGPDHTKTLAGKVRELQAQAAVPIRYCHAKTLLHLRRKLVGPAALNQLLSTALAQDSVLAESFVNALAEEDNTSRRAHESFVKALLSSSG